MTHMPPGKWKYENGFYVLKLGAFIEIRLQIHKCEDFMPGVKGMIFGLHIEVHGSCEKGVTWVQSHTSAVDTMDDVWVQIPVILANMDVQDTSVLLPWMVFGYITELREKLKRDEACLAIMLGQLENEAYGLVKGVVETPN